MTTRAEKMATANDGHRLHVLADFGGTSERWRIYDTVTDENVAYGLRGFTPTVSRRDELEQELDSGGDPTTL